jgi:hypothetical protein
MKIPQRQDQVQLAAPQTQPGKAVQPVEGSLGDSYIKAMQGMSKSFKELSDLQFDLSKNALEGQLNAFDIYVDTRTKQYNQEVAKATTEEQIGELFEKYKVDIAENGNAVLGQDIYNNWEFKKGGAQFAGAQYTGTLASAQLQIKKNKELFKNSANSLNVLAGTAANAKERTEYVNKFNQLVQDNIDNGTLSEAEGQEQKRQFDYDLATSFVISYMDKNPSDCADKLLHDEKFAPEITFSERLRFAQQAMQLDISRKGTSKGIADALKNDWILRYADNQNWIKDENGKLVNQQREIAYRIYDESSEDPLRTARKYAQMLGIDPSKIDADDAIAFRTFMVQSFDFKDQARNDAFNQAYDAAVENVNQLMTIKKKNDTLALDKNPFNFIENFRDSEYKNVDKDSIDKFISSYYTANDMFNDTYSRALLGKNHQAREKLQEQNNMIADVIVQDIEKPWFHKDGYYGRMREKLKEVDKRLTNAGLLYGDKNRKMRNVVKYMLDNNKVETLFNGQQDDTTINEAVASALDYALRPENDFERIGALRIAYGMEYSGTAQERIAEWEKSKK